MAAAVLCGAGHAWAQAAGGEAGGRLDPTAPSDRIRELLEREASPDPQAAPRGVVRIEPGEEGRLAVFELSGVTLGEAMRELGRATGLNVVAGPGAVDREASLLLRDVSPDEAVEAVATALGLVVRRNESGTMLWLFAPENYRMSLAPFRREQTRVFTLLYPNAADAASVIGDVYGDRVVLSLGRDSEDQLDELERRFDRFDLLDERSAGLAAIGGGTSVRGGGGSLSGRDRDGSDREFDTVLRRDRRLTGDRLDDRDVSPEMSPEMLQRLEDERARRETDLAERLAAQESLIYVSVLRRLNKIVIRTGDSRAMDEIAELIGRLDVPTPLVLLEVKILRIELGDGLDSAFDFSFRAGDFAGSFSRGAIVNPGGSNTPVGGVGINSRAGVFQVVSDNFSARLSMLEDQGRVTALATPLILTANGEVSRIFSGQQIPITIGFTEPQVIVGDGASTSLPASPVTELRDVGTELLLTADINADRTVTLRLLQESSSVLSDGATILVPNADGSLDEQTIDVVQSQRASGTTVGQDGQMLAFGGLIEETLADSREAFPVLGDLPLLGMLFRRDSNERTRSELVVLFRPFVLDTPADGARLSRELLRELSLHPSSGELVGETIRDLGSHDPAEVLTPDEAARPLLRLIRPHGVPAVEPTP